MVVEESRPTFDLNLQLGLHLTARTPRHGTFRLSLSYCPHVQLYFCLAREHVRYEAGMGWVFDYAQTIVSGRAEPLFGPASSTAGQNEASAARSFLRETFLRDLRGVSRMAGFAKSLEASKLLSFHLRAGSQTKSMFYSTEQPISV